jgi:hypothetical protein
VLINLALGRRKLLDQFRHTNDISGACVYSGALQAPLQQQTLVKPLEFHNVCAPNDYVPPVKGKVNGSCV